MSEASRRRGPSLVRDSVTSILAAVWFAFVFFLVFPAGVLWLSGELPRVTWDTASVLGALLIAASQAVVGGAVTAFVREGRGTHAPFDPPREFVATGFYRWLRNPMYAAYAVTIAGEALLVASWALGAYTVAFVAVAHAYVVGHEEKALGRRFGASYATYCASVPRWIPRIPGRS